MKVIFQLMPREKHRDDSSLAKIQGFDSKTRGKKAYILHYLISKEEGKV